MRRLPPLNWLRSFEASARHLSFTEAAEELNLTQTAVSQHVKLLEQFLQQPLFHRLPRSLRLTEAGKAYCPRVGQVFDQLGEVTAEVFGERGANSLTIRVNAAFSVLWLADRLAQFGAAHPDLELKLINPIWPVELGDDETDLEIRYGNGQWPGLTAEALTSDVLFPVAAPSLAHLRDPAELLAHRLITVVGYTSGWPRWLSAAGVSAEPTCAGMQCDNSIMALEAAAAGAGVALGRSSLASGQLGAGRLVAPFNLKVPSDEQYYLVAAAGKTLSPGAQSFRRWLLDQIDAAPLT